MEIYVPLLDRKGREPTAFSSKHFAKVAYFGVAYTLLPFKKKDIKKKSENYFSKTNTLLFKATGNNENSARLLLVYVLVLSFFTLHSQCFRFLKELTRP